MTAYALATPSSRPFSRTRTSTTGAPMPAVRALPRGVLTDCGGGVRVPSDRPGGARAPPGRAGYRPTRAAGGGGAAPTAGGLPPAAWAAGPWSVGPAPAAGGAPPGRRDRARTHRRPRRGAGQEGPPAWAVRGAGGRRAPPAAVRAAAQTRTAGAPRTRHSRRVGTAHAWAPAAGRDGAAGPQRRARQEAPTGSLWSARGARARWSAGRGPWPGRPQRAAGWPWGRGRGAPTRRRGAARARAGGCLYARASGYGEAVGAGAPRGARRTGGRASEA